MQRIDLEAISPVRENLEGPTLVAELKKRRLRKSRGGSPNQIDAPLPPTKRDLVFMLTGYFREHLNDWLFHIGNAQTSMPTLHSSGVLHSTLWNLVLSKHSDKDNVG